jgi:Immune inhibitor A peptidase M6
MRGNSWQARWRCLAAAHLQRRSFELRGTVKASGTHYMFAGSRDDGWQRRRKTVDMTGKTAGDLKFKISYDTEDQFDFVVVEAHTVGQDDWTTLEEKGCGTEANVGASCDINWDTLHPFLTHYQTNVNNLRISKRTLRVDRKRRTKVRLACGPTKGTLRKGVVRLTRKRTLMGRRSFSTTAGKTRSITVRIKKSAFRRLTRQKRIGTTITLVSRGSDGVLRKKSQRVTMVRAKATKAKNKKS